MRIIKSQTHKLQALNMQDDSLIFKNLADALPVAIYQCGLDHNDELKLLYISNSIKNLTGLQAKTIKRDIDTLLGKIVSEDYSKFVKTHIQAFKDRHHFHQEIRFKRNYKETRWLSVKSSPFLLPDSSLVYQGYIEDITDRKKAEDEVRKLAFYDTLTNLPNRRLLLEHIEKSISQSERSGIYNALIFIDLDNFKALNDTKGHDIGDLLLIETAKRLQTTIRKSDTVARFGGDEFIILLNSLDPSLEQATKIADKVAHKIIEEIRRPFKLKNYKVKSSTSLGLTMFKGDEYSIEQLLKHADLAMYQAKASGRDTLCLFEQKQG